MAQFLQHKTGYNNNPFHKTGLADVNNPSVDNRACVEYFEDFIFPALAAGIPVKKLRKKSKFFFTVKDKPDPDKNQQEG